MLAYWIIGGLILLLVFFVARGSRLERELEAAERQIVAETNKTFAYKDRLCFVEKKPQEVWFKLAGFGVADGSSWRSHCVRLYVHPALKDVAKISAGHNLRVVEMNDQEVVALQGCLPEVSSWERVGNGKDDKKHVVLFDKLYTVG